MPVTFKIGDCIRISATREQLKDISNEDTLIKKLEAVQSGKIIVISEIKQDRYLCRLDKEGIMLNRYGWWSIPLDCARKVNQTVVVIKR